MLGANHTGIKLEFMLWSFCRKGVFMAKCPLFSVCGGCKYDFYANDYREKNWRKFRV